MLDKSKELSNPSAKVNRIGTTIGGVVSIGLLIGGTIQLGIGKYSWSIGTISL